MNIRIYAQAENGKKDIFELQLYNKGGISWKQGIPKKDPPAAKGLKLVFSDDFDKDLSISNDGRGTRYNAHKHYGEILADGLFPMWMVRIIPFFKLILI